MKKNTLLLFISLICLTGFSQDLPKLYEQVRSSVVVIETLSNTSAGGGDKLKVNSTSGQGSGVLISEDGLIWTASHVVHSADFVGVKFTDDDIYLAKVLSTNPLADVALIQIQSGFMLKNKHVAQIADSDSVKIGEDVFVIGAPHGIEQTLSKGIISGRISQEDASQNLFPVEYLQTDAAINPGNSGGPMFNMDGEVIGIASFILTESGGFDGIGFGATSNIAKKVLMDKGNLWTGIEYVYLQDEMAEVFNLPQEGGLLIISVSGEGLGAKIGLKGGYIKATIEGVDLLIGGDVVLEVAGVTMSDPVAILTLRDILTALEKGDTYNVKYLRAGEVISKKIVVD